MRHGSQCSPINVLEAAPSLQGLIMRQGPGRGRKRQTPCTHVQHSTVQTRAETQTQTCLPLCLWGRGHVTVAVTAPALSPTVQYHSSNLCPEEEPLSSSGFAPPLLSFQWRRAHQRTSARYSAACSLWWPGGSSNLRACPVGRRDCPGSEAGWEHVQMLGRRRYQECLCAVLAAG